MDEIEKLLWKEHEALVRWFSMKPEDDAAAVQSAAYELRLAMQAVDAANADD